MIVKLYNKVIKFMLITPLFMTSVHGASLDLKAVYELALEYSLQREIQRQDISIAEEQYSQARGSILPTVSLRARHFRQDRIEGQSFADNYNTSTFINASQPLLQGLREYTALGIARESIARSERVVQTFEREILFSISRLYYSILMDQRELENTKELIKLTRDRVRDLRQRVDIGRSRTSELILAQTQLATVEAREQSLERNLARLWNEFELMTGRSERTQLVGPQGEVMSLAPVDDYLELIDQLPELQRAKIDLDLADRRVELARRFHYPSLSLDTNFYLQRDGVQRARDWDLSLNLTFPLFEGFKVQSQTREATLNRRKAHLEMDHLRRNLTSEIKELHSTLQIDLGRITITRRAVDLARQNYEEQRREYNLGLVTNQEVLQALNSYIENQQIYDRLRLETAYNSVILKAKVGEDW